jgi:polysaccharide biosynthesis/export protein
MSNVDLTEHGSERHDLRPRMNMIPSNATGNAGICGVCAAVGWWVLSAFLLGAPMLLVAGCQSSASLTDPGLHDVQAAGYATNLLQEGDVVNISFEVYTNFNSLQKISLDGMLYLESVAPVKAAGSTVPELQMVLTNLYKPKIKDDVITVKLVSSASSVYISGAVVRPGKIPLERPMTALEAIMEAGGYDPNRAKLSEVTVLRVEAGRQKAYHLDLKQVIQGHDEEPFYLKPFDIVHVPIKTFNY